MDKLKFAKMHAIGNDFVVVDGSNEQIKDGFSKTQVQFLANRQTGIGADQILWINPSSTSKDSFEYRIWNYDGGEVAQCGNGARAVYRYLQLLGLHKETITLHTATTTIDVGEGANGIKAWLGIPKFEPNEIPMDANPNSQNDLSFVGSKQEKDFVEHTLMYKNQNYAFGAINIGNPHAIFMLDEGNDELVNGLGYALNNCSIFPEGVNVSFVKQKTQQNKFHIRVYERGVGETCACGSAASALAVIGQQKTKNKQIEVEFKGGILQAGWDGKNTKAWIEGQVTHVFDGNISLTMR